MIAVRQIEFERAEGTTAECTAHVFTSWDAVHVHVRRAALTAPNDGTYDKCDVKVTWQDGTSRTVRFDMTYKDSAAETPIADEVFSNVRFFSGRHCPPSMDELSYQAFVGQFDEHVFTDAQKLLGGGYDFGGAELDYARAAAS